MSRLCVAPWVAFAVAIPACARSSASAPPTTPRAVEVSGPASVAARTATPLAAQPPVEAAEVDLPELPSPPTARPGSTMPSRRRVLRQVILSVPESLSTWRPAWVEFRDGGWDCPAGEDDSPCGDMSLSDALVVDFDRDGTDELVVALAHNGGGSHSELYLLAYRWSRSTGRFILLADLAPEHGFSSAGEWPEELVRYGKHCIEARGVCGKVCNGCRGIPCRHVFAWQSGRFGEALFEADMASQPDLLAQREMPRRRATLLATCAGRR